MLQKKNILQFAVKQKSNGICHLFHTTVHTNNIQKQTVPSKFLFKVTLIKFGPEQKHLTYPVRVKIKTVILHKKIDDIRHRKLNI